MKLFFRYYVQKEVAYVGVACVSEMILSPYN
jgi:hypothetical protein